MSKQNIELLMIDLGNELGIDNLKLDEDACCCLSFDDIILHFEFDAAQNRLLCYSHLGDVPPFGQSDFYEMLLDANLFWKGTGGHTLSIDSKSKAVILVSQVDSNDTKLEQLTPMIGSFLDVSDIWRRKIVEFNNKTSL
ncbi:type III secretion system chaperone [Vibrio sp. S4M6]|uniref:type III secretion system chaperone n=1 Tax=Vibrio sinus TaxID=2946865 RepID=UPI00202A3E82|nr:type III secretion system chaperone [Vibrio sinus]MCL9783814.1 type III secretion system chaperone [Vibrio sinus]